MSAYFMVRAFAPTNAYSRACSIGFLVLSAIFLVTQMMARCRQTLLGVLPSGDHGLSKLMTAVDDMDPASA